MTLVDLTGSLVVGLATSVISAYVTVRLALKRFYFEKWWERKADAYTDIIEALHHIRNHADHNLVCAGTNREVSVELEHDLTENLLESIATLRKLVDVGSFVIAEEAVKALRTLMNDLDAATKTSGWVDHLLRKLEAVDKCLDSMRTIAKHDLKLR